MQTAINCMSENTVDVSSICFQNVEHREIVPQKDDSGRKLKYIFLKHHVSRSLGDDILQAPNEDGIKVARTVYLRTYQY